MEDDDGEIKGFRARDVPPYEPRVKIEGKYINFYNEDGSPIKYPLELSSIQTAMDLLRWTRHIGGKTWMTKEMVLDFISIVGKRKKINFWTERYDKPRPKGKTLP